MRRLKRSAARASTVTAWGGPMRMLTTAAWVVVAIAWQAYQIRQNHNQLLRRFRDMSERIDSIDDRVHELSNDRTQAAAAVTRLFGDRRHHS